MKIIEKGHLSPEKEKHNIFRCKKCECVFVAAENEYTYNFVYDVSIINCPCCKNLVETKGPGVTEEEAKIKNYKIKHTL